MARRVWYQPSLRQKNVRIWELNGVTVAGPRVQEYHGVFRDHSSFPQGISGGSFWEREAERRVVAHDFLRETHNVVSLWCSRRKWIRRVDARLEDRVVSECLDVRTMGEEEDSPPDCWCCGFCTLREFSIYDNREEVQRRTAIMLRLMLISSSSVKLLASGSFKTPP